MVAKRICIIPKVSGIGGMVSFRQRLAAGLVARGWEICSELSDDPYKVILVIGGTRQLLPVWQARRRGIPVIQRLNGMNWLHRLPPGPRIGQTSWRHYLRSEYGNLILRLIRSRLATHVVYQSDFARGWWEHAYGAVSASHSVIHNGVDLRVYTPVGDGKPPLDRCRLLMVEGSLAGGYEQGLLVAVELAQRLGQSAAPFADQVELMVVGRVSPEIQQAWDKRVSQNSNSAPLTINWVGSVPGEHIPEIDRSAHLFYSSDIHPACPNSVIEALACGLPVVAFDTGALPELVIGDAGRIVPYGSNPWLLDPPNIDALVHASTEILGDLDRFRRGARARAESAFDLDDMVDSYLQVFEGV